MSAGSCTQHVLFDSPHHRIAFKIKKLDPHHIARPHEGKFGLARLNGFHCTIFTNTARANGPVIVSQGNRASEAFDECSQEVIAPSWLFELHAV